MIVIKCDGCGKELQPDDVFAVYMGNGDGWLALYHATRDMYVPRAKKHICSRDCGELVERGAQATLRKPFDDKQRIWLRYALDTALTVAEASLPYERSAAEAPKATPKKKRALKALEARIAAFKELSELLK